MDTAEREQVYPTIRTVCGFLGQRPAPILARMSGTIMAIEQSPARTVVTIQSETTIREHHIPPRDRLLENLEIGCEVLSGEALTHGQPRLVCTLQAAWAFHVRTQNGHAMLPYERIAALTGVPKSSVFQAERAGLALLKKKIEPFMSQLKELADDNREDD